MALAGAGLRLDSRLFLGWFGPRGLASVLFALLIVEAEGIASAPRLSAIVFATVLVSTFAHGVSAWPLARLYARRLATVTPSAEHREVIELPVRIPHSDRS